MARRKPKLTAAQLAELERQKLARKAYVEDMTAKGLSVKCDAAWNIISIRRLDVFALLHERKGAGDKIRGINDQQFYAIRRFEGLIALANGWERPEQGFDRVDRTVEGAPGQNITQSMIDASEELEFVIGKVGMVGAKVLMALVGPDAKGAALLTRWRETMERVTGEPDSRVQAALIRWVCESLVSAWKALDYRSTRRKRP